MNEELIKYMASRFLGWKLPNNFTPDAGISFKAEYNENTPYPARHEPTGTNLLDYNQALEMVQYMVEGFKNEVKSSEPSRYELPIVAYDPNVRLQN